VTEVHATAIVSAKAELAEGVKVQPYAIIEEGVRIGEGTVIGPHAFLEGNTTIGAHCLVGTGSVIGSPPQDDKYKGEPTQVIIGDNSQIREYVTIHCATGEGNVTRVGNNCRLMAYSHLGHNCQVGDNVSIANYGGMSGHTVIESGAVIGGMVGSHQFVRVGRLAMVSGFSKISVDVPPFALADGKPARVVTINTTGLRRTNFDAPTRARLAKAFKILFRSNMNLSNALEILSAQSDNTPETEYLIEFMRRTQKGFAGRADDPRGRGHG